MPLRRLYRVFLSSPGDVAAERAIARHVIQRLNYDPAIAEYAQLKLIAWDSEDSRTPLLATKTPQQAINEGLLLPSQCDIVIVIFWSRMGTPLDVATHGTRLDGKPYESGTEWEYLDASTQSLKEGFPYVIVYRRNEPVSLNPDDPQYDEKYNQYRAVQRFFERSFTSKGVATGGYNWHSSPTHFEELLSLDIKSVVKRLLLTNVGEANESDFDILKISPYPGLNSFSSENETFFYGRGRETDELVGLFRNPNKRFCAVIGATGTGKSSLVGAGLFSQLRANAIEGSKDWILLGFTPTSVGVNPLLAIGVALEPLLLRHGWNASRIASTLSQQPELLDTLCRLALPEDRPWAQVLFFIDQFEELFTAVDNSQRQSFVGLFSHVGMYWRVVIGLRIDFVDQANDYPALVDLLRTDSYLLSAPNDEQLAAMIIRPAEQVGFEFEPKLVERIIDEGRNEADRLVLTAYILGEMFHASKEESQFTHSVYEDLGGIYDAIGNRADAVISQFDVDTQGDVEELFGYLVHFTSGKFTRRKALLSDIAERDKYKNKDTLQRLVSALVETGLLITSWGKEDKPAVEVVHEVLFKHWPQLTNWINQYGSRSLTPNSVLDYHRQGRPGKIAIQPTKPLASRRDMSMAFSPGVYEVALELAEDRLKSYEFTAKSNLVGLVTDGTALGHLGSRGPYAAKPVLEGQSAYLKSVADIDAIDLELQTLSVDEFVAVCAALSPSFGAISIEGVKAPECLLIEESLQNQLDIPVYLNSLDTLGILIAAALSNALELVNKSFKDIKVLFIGSGPHVIKSYGFLLDFGVVEDNIMVADMHGVIYEGREVGFDRFRSRFARATDARTIADALENVDVLIGISAAGIAKAEWLSRMATDPIIFAFGSPTPEVQPERVMRVRPDAIIATTRADYPNQIYNQMCYPYLLRGALDVWSTQINMEMKRAAAHAIASLAREETPNPVKRLYGIKNLSFGRELLLPKPLDARLLQYVAYAVAEAALRTGVAKRSIDLSTYQNQLKRLQKSPVYFES